MTTPRIVGDRLYGLSIRPQEFETHGRQAEIALRYSPIFEDPDEVTDVHFKVMVLELVVELEADDPLAEAAGESLELVKCGWELELEVDKPCTVGSLPELPEEVPLLLGKIASTINDLAVRAGLEAPPFPDELVASLVESYQAQHPPKTS